MQSLASIVLIALVGVAVAQRGGGGGHGFGRHGGGFGGFGQGGQQPASCDGEREQHQSCVQAALKAKGLEWDHDAVHKCFDSCERPEGGRGGGKGAWGQGGGKGGWGGHRGGNGTRPEGSGDWQKMGELFKCINDATEPKVDACLKSKISFPLSEQKRGFGGKGRGRGGRHARQADDDSQGGRRGGRGRGRHGGRDHGIARMLERAEQCGVADCVKAALPASIVANPDSVKQAQCEARKQCRNENSQCQQERQKLRVAQCECSQSVDHDAIKKQCEQSTGVSAPEGKGHGRRGGNRDCSQVGQGRRHDDDDDQC